MRVKLKELAIGDRFLYQADPGDPFSKAVMIRGGNSVEYIDVKDGLGVTSIPIADYIECHSNNDHSHVIRFSPEQEVQKLVRLKDLKTGDRFWSVEVGGELEKTDRIAAEDITGDLIMCLALSRREAIPTYPQYYRISKNEWVLPVIKEAPIQPNLCNQELIEEVDTLIKKLCS